MSGPTVSIKINGDARGIQAATEQAKVALKSTTEGVESLASSIKAMPGFGGIAASLGALASAGAIKQLIGDTIEWAAGMERLSIKTGASVENLSGLSRLAKINGTDFGMVETTLIRFSKALSGADEEAKGAGHALAFLGLNAAELRNMDPAEALEKTAVAMEQYGDGTGKTALAMALWGREGAQMLPLIKDLAEQHLKAGKLTTEQAKAAEDLEKSFRKVNYEGGQWSKQIVVDLIPTLASLLDYVTATKAGIFQIGSSLAVVANDISVFTQVALTAIVSGVNGNAKIKELLDGRRRFVEAANEDMVKRFSSIESIRDKIDATLAGKADTRKKPNYTARDPKEDPATKAKDLTSGNANALAIADKLTLKWAEQTEAAQRAMQIMPEAQRKFAEAMAAVDKESIAGAMHLGEMMSKKEISPKVYTEALYKLTIATAAYKAQAAETAAKQEALNASWEYGADRALQKYLDTVNNVTAQSEAAFTRGIKGMEDALVNFAMTGKLDFKSLANSIISDMIRMQIQASVTKPLAAAVQSSGGFGGLLGSLFGYGDSTQYAEGYGPNAKGNVYASADLHRYANTIVSSPTLFKFAQGGAFSRGLMGEAGPEAIMPLTRINGKLGVQASGGGSISITMPVTIDARGADASVIPQINAALSALKADILRTIPAVVSRQQLRNRITPMSA